jgi:hypothetical protein
MHRRKDRFSLGTNALLLHRLLLSTIHVLETAKEKPQEGKLILENVQLGQEA